MNRLKLQHTVQAVADAATGLLQTRPTNVQAGRKGGILSFIGNLLTNSVFLGSGRTETAPLRGSLAGLARGVDAVLQSRRSPNAPKAGTGRSLLTIGGYVAAGMAAAWIYRSMRRPEMRQ